MPRFLVGGQFGGEFLGIFPFGVLKLPDHLMRVAEDAPDDLHPRDLGAQRPAVQGTARTSHRRQLLLRDKNGRSGRESSINVSGRAGAVSPWREFPPAARNSLVWKVLAHCTATTGPGRRKMPPTLAFDA